MIKIKNYIFNESYLISIKPISDGLRVDLKNENDYIDIYATVDDIECNYGSIEKIYTDKLEKELNKLVNEYSLLVTENKELKEKLDEILKDKKK